MSSEFDRDSGVTYIGPRTFVAVFALMCCGFLAIVYSANRLTEFTDAPDPLGAIVAAPAGMSHRPRVKIAPVRPAVRTSSAAPAPRRSAIAARVTRLTKSRPTKLVMLKPARPSPSELQRKLAKLNLAKPRLVKPNSPQLAKSNSPQHAKPNSPQQAKPDSPQLAKPKSPAPAMHSAVGTRPGSDAVLVPFNSADRGLPLSHGLDPLSAGHTPLLLSPATPP